MAIDFAGNVNAEVDYGSGAGLDNAIPFTKLFWFILRTGFANNDRLWTKSTSADASIHVHNTDELRLRSKIGDPAVAITDDSPLSADTWIFAAVCYDSGAAQFGRIFTGTLDAIVTERSLGVSNNTAWGDDAADDYTLGNKSDGGLNLTGEIAFFADINATLTLEELQRIQYRPDLWVQNGTRIFTWLGKDGTGTQEDLSGNGNAGSGSNVALADHVPVGPLFGWDGYVIGAAGPPAQTIDPDSIASAEAFGTPQLDLTILPDGFGGEVFGNLTIKQALLVDSIATAEAFGNLTINQAIPVDSIASAEAHGTPTLDFVKFLIPTGIATGQAFGEAVIEMTITPDAIASGEAFGLLNILKKVFPDGIPSEESVQGVTIDFIISPLSVTPDETFGVPQVNYTIRPDSVPSAEAHGTPRVICVINVDSVPSAEAFGLPMISLTIGPIGIVSEEVVNAVAAMVSGRPPIQTPIRTGRPWWLVHIIGRR